MKKVLLTICAFLFISSLYFVQTLSTATAQISEAADETRSLTGKVDSIFVIGNTAKETKAQITVVDDKGQKMHFAMDNDIPVYDKNGKVTTLFKAPLPGDKVAITKNEKNEVLFIKIVDLSPR